MWSICSCGHGVGWHLPSAEACAYVPSNDGDRSSTKPCTCKQFVEVQRYSAPDLHAILVEVGRDERTAPPAAEDLACLMDAYTRLGAAIANSDWNAAEAWAAACQAWSKEFENSTESVHWADRDRHEREVARARLAR